MINLQFSAFVNLALRRVLQRAAASQFVLAERTLV